MIKIIKNNMKEPITITCGECNSIIRFEYTDIQRREEINPLAPTGITKSIRFIVCPVCKATLIFKAPQHLRGISCCQIVLDEKLPDSKEETDVPRLPLQEINE